MPSRRRVPPSNRRRRPDRPAGFGRATAAPDGHRQPVRRGASRRVKSPARASQLGQSPMDDLGQEDSLRHHTSHLTPRVALDRQPCPSSRPRDPWTRVTAARRGLIRRRRPGRQDGVSTPNPDEPKTAINRSVRAVDESVTGSRSHRPRSGTAHRPRCRPRPRTPRFDQPGRQRLLGRPCREARYAHRRPATERVMR